MKKCKLLAVMALLLILAAPAWSVRAQAFNIPREVSGLVLPDDLVLIKPVEEGYEATILEIGRSIISDTPQDALDMAIGVVREKKDALDKHIAQIAEIERQIAALQAKKAELEAAEQLELGIYGILDIGERERVNILKMVDVLLPARSPFEEKFGLDVTEVAIKPAKPGNIYGRMFTWGWTFGTFEEN